MFRLPEDHLVTAHSELPLSAELLRKGFTVRDARTASVSYGRLRGSDLVSPYFGTRIDPRTALTVESRTRLLIRRLGHGVFASHATAAALWRLHLEAGDRGPIHLAVSAPRRAPHAHGLVGHSLRLRPRDVSTRLGIPVTSPIRTWLDLAADGVSLDDLIVAGDRIVHAKAPLATADELADAVELWRGRGIRTIREALAQLHVLSDSGRETRLRHAIVMRGLPSPAIQHPVLDREGKLIGHADLAFPEYRTLLEYEGDHHRADRSQWTHDLDRFNRYQAAGWVPYRINAGNFAELEKTLRLVEDSLRARGWEGP